MCCSPATFLVIHSPKNDFLPIFRPKIFFSLPLSQLRSLSLPPKKSLQPQKIAVSISSRHFGPIIHSHLHLTIN